MTAPGHPAVGERLELTVDDLNHRGEGVGRYDGQVVFVAGGLPGDRLEVRLQHRGRRHLQAQLLQVLEPSADRCRPPCILADDCGGCSLQGLTVEAQRAWKADHLAQTLRRIGGLELTPRPILGAGDGLGYRNRALIPLERRQDGSVRAGYYRRGSHRIVNMNHCPVLDPRLDHLIAPLKHDLAACDWPIDRHLEQGGGLRHLGLRLGHHSGEVLITLVSSHDQLPQLQEQAQEWQRRWPQVVGVGLNLQPEANNLLLGPHTVVVQGRGWLLERFAGLELQIAADTFFQVHTRQAEAVVPRLLEALDSSEAHAAHDSDGAAPTGRGRVVDAYCGIGTFALPLAAAGWSVVGVELQEASVLQAQANAIRNKLEGHCRFVSADVPAVLAEHLAAADALFVDPPRKGLDPRAVAAIRAQPPQRLAYLSCDPATLARDLAQLCGGEEAPYRLAWVQPFDFFPHTNHVESLAALVRR